MACSSLYSFLYFCTHPVSTGSMHLYSLVKLPRSAPPPGPASSGTQQLSSHHSTQQGAISFRYAAARPPKGPEQRTKKPVHPGQLLKALLSIPTPPARSFRYFRATCYNKQSGCAMSRKGESQRTSGDCLAVI